MTEKSVFYFPRPGKQNTEQTIGLAKQRALELKIKYVVVASNTGQTGLKALEAFLNTRVKVVIVSHPYGFHIQKHPMSPETRKRIQELNGTVIISTLPLSSPGRLFRKSIGWKPSQYTYYNTIFPTDLISDTLRMFSQGMKVCVEIAIMAADAGTVPVEEDIIAIGGTRRGADTAVVIKPAHMTNIFDLKIREIIAMPTYTQMAQPSND